MPTSTIAWVLPLCLVASSLTFTACTKEGPPGRVTTAGDGDGEGDPGDGDGDGDPSPAEDTETGMMLIPELDHPVGDGTCDPFAQDCPEGEKCVAYNSAGETWDANKCVPVLGSGAEGDPCSYAGSDESTDDCGADSFCWNVDEDGAGVCAPFCKGEPADPQCEPGHSCVISNEGSINLCLPACDPILQDCGGEEICFYDFAGSFICVFGTDMVPTGEPCGYINDCAAGNICVDAVNLPTCADASCCAAFCDLDSPTCGVLGTECTALFEEGTATPGYEHVGVCTIPGA